MSATLDGFILMKHFDIRAGEQDMPNTKSTGKSTSGQKIHGAHSIETAKGRANIAGKMATDGAKLAKGGKGGSRAAKSSK